MTLATLLTVPGIVRAQTATLRRTEVGHAGITPVVAPPPPRYFTSRYHPFAIHGDVLISTSVTVNLQTLSGRVRLDVPITSVFGLSAAFLAIPAAPGIGINIQSPYLRVGGSASRVGLRVGGSLFGYLVPNMPSVSAGADLELFGRFGIALAERWVLDLGLGVMFLAFSQPFDMFLGLQAGVGIAWLAF